MTPTNSPDLATEKDSSWTFGEELSALRSSDFRTECELLLCWCGLDIDGAPHTNPDGERISGTHLHLFKEGYEDRWAYPVDPNIFTLLSDPGTIFQEFCTFCKIESPPPVQGVIA